MAPRRTKVAGEDDRCPRLRLIMEKGPLSGQTSEFSPRSVIAIGRYVRGNTLSIKDAGISSKHLRIKVEASRWTITDLGSSNGTILNGELLQSPAVLSDGDVIKIGEETSIIVEFEGNVVENEISSRKNARKYEATDLGVIDEFSELGFGNKEDENKSDDVSEIEVIQERNVSTRKAESSQENVSGVSMRRTRSSRKEGGAIEAGIDLSVIEGRKTRGRKRKVVETIPEETEKVAENVNFENGSIGLKTEKEEEKVAEDINFGKEDGSIGLASTSGLKEYNVENNVKGKVVGDLETMSMGEWLDFLEVYLPRQIVEESEAKIAEMRQTALRYHEFMVQQKKLKG